MHKIIFILLILAGCASREEIQHAQYDIRLAPLADSSIERMNQFIISITGQGVFQKLFTFDSLQSGLFSGSASYLKPNVAEASRYMGHKYRMYVYYFHLPQKPEVQWKFWWPTDTLGQFFSNRIPTDIPNCYQDSINCGVRIDSVEALAIVKKAGIPVGIDTIRSILTLGLFKRSKIVWEFVSTISQGRYGAEHLIYDVDAHTGEIINKIGYSVVE